MLFFHYVARKLARRLGNNALTIGVIGIVIGGCILGISFLLGLRAAARESIPAENVFVMMEGSFFEESSFGLPLETVHQLELLPGIRGGDKKAFSPEIAANVLLGLDRNARPQLLRGVDPIAYELHDAKVVEGRAPQPGAPELVAGVQTRRRYPNLTIGSKIQLPHEAWTIVGFFTAGGSTYEKEMWGDRTHLAKPLKIERINAVVIGAASRADAAALIEKIQSSKALQADAYFEREFRGSQAKLRQVSNVVLLLVIILCVIGVFVTATNLHASLVTRMPEFASLITLGVRRSKVATLVMMESLMLALAGAALAVGIALVLHGRSSASFNSIAAFDLRVGVVPIGIGVGLAVLVGVLGGLIPSLIVRRLNLIRGLR